MIVKEISKSGCSRSDDYFALTLAVGAYLHSTQRLWKKFKKARNYLQKKKQISLKVQI